MDKPNVITITGAGSFGTPWGNASCICSIESGREALIWGFYSKDEADAAAARVEALRRPSRDSIIAAVGREPDRVQKSPG